MPSVPPFFAGFEEETWLLQNPPCESGQSLLTSIVQLPQILDRCHLGSSHSKKAVLSQLDRLNTLQHQQNPPKTAIMNQGRGSVCSLHMYKQKDYIVVVVGGVEANQESYLA